jgi:serine/threonine protein kinase
MMLAEMSSFKGTGDFGHVYQAAVKRLRIGDGSPEDVEDCIKKATETMRSMKSLDHEHLIEAIAVYEKGAKSPERYFMFPWADRGNLRDFWRENDRSKHKLAWALDQMKGLAHGLLKLHEQQNLHGDIKPQNILILFTQGDSQLTLVIADVGIAKFHADNPSMRRDKRGIPRYGPPEMELKQDETPSPKMDAWSMGCVLWEFVIWLVRGSQGHD